MFEYDPGMDAREMPGKVSHAMDDEQYTAGVAGEKCIAELDNLIERHYPADPRIVPEARHEAYRFCADAGVSEEDCISLDLALGEALANAVRHGQQGSDEDREEGVTLSMWSYRDSVIAYVHDRGPGFDPPLPPYVMPSPTAEYLGGRGLPLMDLLSDAILVCRGDAAEGGASVFLVKRITGAGHHLKCAA